MASLRSHAFRAWFRLSRPMTMGVRGVVENAAGHVCLIRHTYISGWHFPGGGVEPDEPVITALQRELVEEAGVHLTGAAMLFGVFSNHPNFRNDHVLIYRIQSDAWASVAPTARGEIAACIWADPLAPPQGTTAGTQARLAEIYGGAALSPYWSPTTE
jgi:8-oxo-dGTP pyrophosphatase MutT (NUDIX family)